MRVLSPFYQSQKFEKNEQSKRKHTKYANSGSYRFQLNYTMSFCFCRFDVIEANFKLYKNIPITLQWKRYGCTLFSNFNVYVSGFCA